MIAIIALVIILPIICLVAGVAVGVAAAEAFRQRNNSSNAEPPKEDEEELTEVKILGCAVGSNSFSVEAEVVEAAAEPPIGLPRPGLPLVRTLSRRPTSDSLEQQGTPSAAAAAASSAFAAGGGRPRSPTAHLMGHLVRCASAAMEQMDGRTVLQRLASGDQSTPFLPSSPVQRFLMTPAPSGLLSPGGSGFVEGSAEMEMPWTSTDEIHMDEIDVQGKLGGGAFGSVYRGQWRGAPVAVKYIRTRTDRADSLGRAVREVVLSKKLAHPNCVQTFSWTVLTQPNNDELSSAEGGDDATAERQPSPKRTLASDFGAAFLGSKVAHERSTTPVEGDTIPALWVPHAEPATPSQQLSSTSTESERAEMRGVKRRRTLQGGETPPSSGAVAPRMDSFNSEEGFGSPVKRKHGGVQSIFQLENLHLTPCEAILVVVMEHCDLGSLAQALKKKAFIPSAKWSPRATYRALLRTAAEIAKGMEYIHAQHGVVHGDLKPANVLLKRERADRRGYIAKLADFGLSRSSEHEDDSEVVGGTLAYMAPESFEAPGTQGCPADIFAFGIMLWEMYHCDRPYSNLMEAQICAGVIGGWLRPEFDDDAPLAYRRLAERCWAQEPTGRPKFCEVWRELVKIELEFRSSMRHRSSSSRSGSLNEFSGRSSLAVVTTTNT